MARRRPRVGLVVRRFRPRFLLLAALVAVNRSCWSPSTLRPTRQSFGLVALSAIQAAKEWKPVWRFRRFLGLRWRGLGRPLGSLRESSATGIAHRSAIQPRSLRLDSFVVQAVLPLVASMPSAFGRHPGAAAVIPAVVHARRAFGLQFFPRCQPRGSFRCQPHSNPLERQLRFRRAWRLVRFGNTHSPGGASCEDSGGFLPPLVNARLRSRHCRGGSSITYQEQCCPNLHPPATSPVHGGVPE